ncbi:AVID protein, partial [Erpornis zantholeuca]|nr:AVID protein [Erpornis zantholeuca]
MLQTTPFLLVLFLALGAHSLSVKKCILTGTWVNDLGSNMTISQVNKTGEFTGIYYTAVSATTEKIKKSPLLGYQHLPNLLSQPTFGFTVNWIFSDATSVFTGQCFMDGNGKEILKTMWLMRSHADNLGNDWKATRVGYNNFTRL